MQYYSFNVRVASSFASYSSRDLSFHLMLKRDELDFSPDHFEKGFVINSHCFPMLCNHQISCIEPGELVTFVTFEKDEKLFKHKTRGLSIRERIRHQLVKSPEWDLEKEKYELAGWVEYNNKLPVTKQLELEQFKLGEELKVQEAKNRGVLLAETLYYYSDKPKLTAKQYQGGFSNEVFEHFKDYVLSGNVWGYVGHIERTVETDILIEENLRKLNISPKRLRCWLTSTDARHMMDWLSGKQTQEKVEFIKYSINRIHNLCLVYGSEYHGGTLKSTNEIKSEYEEEGILLPEPELEYTNWHELIFKVMSVL